MMVHFIWVNISEVRYVSNYNLPNNWSENNTLFLVLKTLKKNPYSCSGLSKSKYVCKKEMEQFAQQQYYYFDLEKKVRNSKSCFK